MRYLTITAGEPWAETWGVMLFPEDQLKRRAYIARLWAGFYPIDEEANLGESVLRPVLLSIMKAAAVDCIDKAEIYARYYDENLYGDVLPFGSQEPAPAPVVKDFQTLFGGEGAPPGMDPRVRAGETRRVATFANGSHRYVLYVAPTKNGGFCESFVHLFGGCRQVRTLPAGAPSGGRDEINPFAIGPLGSMSSENTAAILGGDLLVPPGTSLSIEFADGSSAEIPVVFVSPPIDAGFFLYPVPAEHIPEGHQATYLTARNEHGQIVAKARISGPSPQALREIRKIERHAKKQRCGLGC